MTTPAKSIDVLRTGVDSYAPHLQASGELHDPVFDEPTQYGTAYHAYANAVLARQGPTEHRADHLDRATRGLDAALTHTSDPRLPAAASGFSAANGTVSRGNHRDFTWPPILKTYRILRDAGHPRAAEFAERIAAVDIEASFNSRPPSNWASVWLSGEWIRHREGLSPFSAAALDDWLGVFFDELILLDQGFYQEPGLPNSYDLFTRYHLLDILTENYTGRWEQQLRTLLRTGLDRSLAVQLSDGSLASAHRSTGQTWTVSAQLAYFTLAANLVDDPEQADAARAGARRALASFVRWQRDGAPFSPVENRLPLGYRVGFESYTGDGHYANLALAFLAAGIHAGFDDAGDLTEHPPSVRAEHAPTYRAIAHQGTVSVHVDAAPAAHYDAFGITDLTFGPGRFLHFASSAHHAATDTFVNLGLAHRAEAGRTPLAVVSQRSFELTEPIRELSDPPGIALTAKAAGPVPDAGPSTPAYALHVTTRPDGVDIAESTPGTRDHKTLLIPYLRDAGTGIETTVEIVERTIRLRHGDEELRVDLDADIEHVVHLPYGFTNRRGLCGLLRVDLLGEREGIDYHITAVAR